MAQGLNRRWAAALVEALRAGGVEHAVVCPGSRSTPLALGLAHRNDVRHWVVTDERSAAYFALGLAKATRRPVAVVCTSGTAGAHFLPAMMEASAQGVALVALTADRPWELHGFGAAQTVEQQGLFGRFVRGALNLAEPFEAGLDHVHAAVAKLLAMAVHHEPGPVHVNVPFRDPLIETETSAQGEVAAEVAGFIPEFHFPRDRVRIDRVRAAVESAERGMIVCGPREGGDGFGAALNDLGRHLGFAVLADAASNARFGFSDAVSLYDAMLRHSGFAASMKPDVVLRFGGGLTSKVAQAWLEECGARTFVFSEDSRVSDPLHCAQAVLVGDGSDFCEALSRVRAPASAYRGQWLKAEGTVRRRLAGIEGPLTEPMAARALVEALPAQASLMVSNSMPIRDVDAFASHGAEGLRVYSNRGLNGIDGVTSTALGVAAASSRPTALLVGDVALLHDLSAWVIARTHRLSLVLVAVNNDGGGIFHFLPVAEQTQHFESLFATPHGVDLSAVAALGGARLHRPEDLPSFRRALAFGLEGGLHLIEVRSRRQDNVSVHRALQAMLVEGLQ